MSERVVIFPFGRSAGVVRAFAAAQARHDATEAINAAWRRTATDLAEQLVGVVPNATIDRELYVLLDASAFVANRSRAARQRAAAKRQERARLRLVEPRQGDLFGWAAKPAVVARIEGEHDATA